jgi:hypothetical protein
MVEQFTVLVELDDGGGALILTVLLELSII